MPGGVVQIGYVEIEVTEEGRWLALADAIGFEVMRSAERGIGLRMDADRWARIHLRPGSVDKLSAVGWEAASLADFRTIVDRLQQSGVRIEERSDIAVLRNVAAVVRFEGPDNLPGELYHSPRTLIRSRFRSPEFVTFAAGSAGMGHVTLAVSDIEAAVAFYQEVIGLKLTEVADVGSLNVTFLRAGERHHSLALTQLPTGQAGVDHIMVEVATLDDLGAMRDRLIEQGHSISRDLGRHPTDGVISLYVDTPAAFMLEIGWGSIQVDERTWNEARYARNGWSWGHRKPGMASGGLGLPET